MNNSDNWYCFEHAEQIDSPALVIYPERVKENINILKSMMDGPSELRPHVKTHKTKEAALLMMEVGISKFKCATIAETEMLGMCRAPDVLLAYQPTLPKLLRFIELIKNYPQTRFSCLTDNQASAELISATAESNGLIISVYLDLNVGMDRTGIKPGNEAVELFDYAEKLPGLELQGLHAYDGHIREKDIKKRTELCNDAFSPVEKMRSTLKRKGYPMPKLIAGGSPTFLIHANRENCECSPGTFVFWDKGYSGSIPEQKFLFAALVLARVISLPDKNKICIDLGYKSVAAENDLQHRVFFLNAPGLKPISHSEEHMVVEAEHDHKFKIGDLLYALPMHICPTVALYSQAICIESGKIAGNWEIIAQDRKIIY